MNPITNLLTLFHIIRCFIDDRVKREDRDSSIIMKIEWDWSLYDLSLKTPEIKFSSTIVFRWGIYVCFSKDLKLED